MSVFPVLVLNIFNDALNTTYYKALNDGVLGCQYRYTDIRGYELDNGVVVWLFLACTRLFSPRHNVQTGCGVHWVGTAGKAAGSRSWTFSKLLVTTVGFEPAASQFRSRDTSDAVSLNKVNNKNLIALCSYCTEVHTLTLQCWWLFYVAPVVTLRNSVPRPQSALLSFFNVSTKGQLFPYTVQN